MAQDIVAADPREVEINQGKDKEDFVSFMVGGQLFGIPILKVQDILKLEDIASIPLAPPKVKGSINLRGRIVTVISVRVCLGLSEMNENGEDETVEEAIIEDDESAETVEEESAETVEEASAETVEEESAETVEEESAEDVEEESAEDDEKQLPMGVTIEFEHDLYTLLVDSVGDVISASPDCREGNPSTLDPAWREFANGVYRLEDRLMVSLDVERLLGIAPN